jgi:hypothetical protein
MQLCGQFPPWPVGFLEQLAPIVIRRDGRRTALNHFKGYLVLKMAFAVLFRVLSDIKMHAKHRGSKASYTTKKASSLFRMKISRFFRNVGVALAA